MAYSDVMRQVAQLIVTPKCFDKYLIDFNFLDVECFKATLSKILGLGLIMGSIMVKIPQILKIVKNRSGTGINLLSVTMELVAITIYMSYSFVKQFPFSSWGDTFFLSIQTVVIAMLVLSYSGKVIHSVVYLLTFLGVCYVLMSGLTPLNILWTLTSVNILIVVCGKLLQAHTNYTNGNTGQLSGVTLVMVLAGSSARIFTSIQETGDTIAIMTYVASTMVNALLVGQLVYYWNATEVPQKKKKKQN